MGTKYTTESLTGYNTSPPSDDGTAADSNKVNWTKHKDKLGDPLKTQIANINAKLVTAADIGPDAKAVNYTTLVGDHEKTIEVTAASVTITLLAVASAPEGYKLIIKNSSGSTADVDATASETIDGSAAVITLADNETLTVQLNEAQDGYISLQQVASTGTAGLTSINTFTKNQVWSKGADVASATALILGTDGNSFDVTGTTTITSIATLGAGIHVTLQFDGILTLTHHATDLILPGGVNITTAAGDIGVFYEYAAGDWRCVSYTVAALAAGTASTASTAVTQSQGDNSTNIATTAYADAAGALKKIDVTQTASASSSIEFSTGIDSTYDTYIVKFSGVIPSLNTNAFRIRVSTDGGSTFLTTSIYDFAIQSIYVDGTATAVATQTSGGTINLAAGISNVTTYGVSGSIEIHNPSSTALHKQIKVNLTGYESTADCYKDITGVAVAKTTSAVDAIEFTFSTGTIVSGIFSIYGVAK